MTVDRSTRTWLGSLPHRAATLLDPLISFVLPRRCPVCGQPDPLDDLPWCDACANHVCLWTDPICPVCRRFLSGDAETCVAGHERPQPQVVFALGGYDAALGAVVRALKYDGVRSIAAPLGRLIAARIPDNLDLAAVVAVPTSAAKRRERGFGHAEEIAARVAVERGIPYSDGMLGFARRVSDQTRLSAARRRENMKGALAARPDELLARASVLVVDDVMTTGATITEASRALIAAGVGRVYGAIVALNLGGEDRTDKVQRCV